MKTKLPLKNIPLGWRLTKASDILDVRDGTHATPKQVIHGVPLITSKNIINGSLDISRTYNVSVLDAQEINKRSEVKTNDILISMIGTVGEAAIIKYKPNFVVKNVGIFKAGSKSILSNFLIKQLHSRYLRDKVQSLSSGGIQRFISLGQLRKLPLLLPPLPEQNRIVAVLETWDKAIELLKKKIEIKKEVKKGLMQLLLSRKIRLKGFTEKWETVELGNISNFVNGYTFKSSTYVDDGMYKIITIANVQDGHLLMDKPKLINELPSNLSREQILSKGDILISMTGNVGRVCIVDQDGGLLNQRVGKIIPRGINKDLFYLFLHDRRFLNTMIDSAQGGAQGNLSTSDIKLYRFDIPTSSREQDMLADILTASNKEIQVLELKQKVMQEQKTYLLNHLITGQIRTPENLKIFS